MTGIAYDLASAAADYPSWQGPPRRTLVICTQQRSGSTLLGEALYFAGGLGCPLEYLHEGLRPLLAARWQAPDLPAYIAQLQRFRTDPSAVFSLKLFWRDAVRLARELSPADLGALRTVSAAPMAPDVHRRIYALLCAFLPNPDWLFLTRRDNVQQAVSLSIAGQSGRWRDFSASPSPGQSETPEYRFDEICRILAVIQKSHRSWIEFFQANDLSPHEIVYEDLAHDYAGTLRKLFSAFGKHNAAIAPPRLHRQADDLSRQFLQRFMSDFHRRAR